MSFSLDDYVDVPERIRLFAEKYPDGSLQSEVSFVDGGVLCKAYAYRTPVDERPGVGHAFEPVPGKTPYTKDSEVMNAETSAWGRAIVALGFETKKIASKQEIQNRQPSPSSGEDGKQAEGSSFQAPAGAGDSLGLQSSRADAPDDGGDPAMVLIHFGKNAGKRLGELTKKQQDWYATTWKPNPQYENEQDRRLKQAALILCDSLPF